MCSSVMLLHYGGLSVFSGFYFEGLVFLHPSFSIFVFFLHQVFLICVFMFFHKSFYVAFGYFPSLLEFITGSGADTLFCELHSPHFCCRRFLLVVGLSLGRSACCLVL